MMGYVKSFVAVGLALAVCLGAGLWFRDRTNTLASITKERKDLAAQIADVRECKQLLGELQKKNVAIDQLVKDATSRLAVRGSEGPQLVGLAVKAASSAGVKMTGTFENAVKDGQDSVLKGKSVSVLKTSYRFCLVGSYTGLVKFFRNMSAWDIQAKLESLQISPADDKVEGDIGGECVISVYSMVK